MKSTVVGSFPATKKEASSFKDKLLKSVGSYDPFKQAIRETVIAQLDAGVDIVSDGQVRGDMVSIFTQHIPGMKLEDGNTVIVSKIRNPTCEISVDDLKFAKNVIKEYYDGKIPDGKGVKGIITGPSTIVHSSRIASFYKNKDDAIIDLAHSLKHEVDAIADKVKPSYIQIDEPFLSTGMVNINTAKKAVAILKKDLDVPLAMHVCGDLTNVFKQLTTFDIDIFDFEFAGNDTNFKVLKDNVDLLKGKTVGFGCIDSSKNELDSYDKTDELIKSAVELLGKDNIILDPDCGLRRAPKDIAFSKLKLMNEIKDKY